MELLTGVIPHQVRTQFSNTAIQLIGSPAKVFDIRLDSELGYVSNFKRAFRKKFDVSH
jgi:hypothetical protein